MFKVAVVGYTNNLMLDFNMYKEKFDPAEYQVDEVWYHEGKEEEFVRALDGYDAIIQSGGFFAFTPEMIKGLSTVKIIHLIGTGFVSEVAKAAEEAGIMYCIVSDYSTKEVADHACALILALNRHLFGFNRAIQQDHVWNSRLFKGDMPKLETLTLGICGFGAIGRAVAKRMLAFGMKVIAYDPYVKPEIAEAMGVELVSFDEMLENSDFIENAMALTPETTGMFNMEAFKKMKKKPYVINNGRGGHIVEDDIIEALDTGLIRGAGLDMLSKEVGVDLTQPNFARFLGRENVIITPHCGFFSDYVQPFQCRLCTTAVKNLLHGDTTDTVIVNKVRP